MLARLLVLLALFVSLPAQAQQWLNRFQPGPSLSISNGSILDVAPNPLSPQAFGAKGDCATNDSAALAAAAAAANIAGKQVLVDRCYVVVSTLSLTSNMAFVSGGLINAVSGAALTITGSVSADSGQQIFSGAGSVTLATAPFVSVAWWGGLNAAAVGGDAAPAFRAAVGSNRTYYIPAANYTFRSYTLGFIGAASPGGGLVSTAVFFNGLQGFKVDATGASFNLDAVSAGTIQGAAAVHFFFNNNQNFEVTGGVYNGSKAGVGSNSNVAFVNHNAVNFEFSNIHLTGNFGSPYNTGGGTGFAIDYNLSGVYRNITIDAVGLGFDTAFLHDVQFDHINCYGAGVDGGHTAGDFGRSCISIIYDGPSVGYNTTGYLFTTSDNVKITNSRAQNFYYGFLIGDGAEICVCNNYILGGNATPPQYGVYFGWSAASSIPSLVKVQGNTISNFQYGAFVETLGLTGAISFNANNFNNNIFQSNDFAFGNDDATAAYTTNLQISPGNQYYNNTSVLDANTMLLRAFSQQPGTFASDAAAAGNIGEVKNVTIVSASAASLTSGSPLNIATISLGWGDWDVWGECYFGGASATTVTAWECSVSPTSATIFANPPYAAAAAGSGTPYASLAFKTETVPPSVWRVQSGSPQSAYLVAQSSFSGGTSNAWGAIYARRRR